MKMLALILLTGVSLVGTAGIAPAQYYGGGPYYDNPGPFYRGPYREPRYYDDERYERRRYYPDRRVYRTWNGCPPRYTIQDGICKPYRGY